MNGMATAASASRRATEVWVKAAGLIRMKAVPSVRKLPYMTSFAKPLVAQVRGLAHAAGAGLAGAAARHQHAGEERRAEDAAARQQAILDNAKVATHCIMRAIAERLGELGIALPEVVAPLAAYVPAVRTGRDAERASRAHADGCRRRRRPLYE